MRSWNSTSGASTGCASTPSAEARSGAARRHDGRTKKPRRSGASLNGEGAALASCRARRPPGKEEVRDACSARERADDAAGRCAAAGRWRGPESNWRHHDFQSWIGLRPPGKGGVVQRKCPCKSALSAPTVRFTLVAERPQSASPPAAPTCAETACSRRADVNAGQPESADAAAGFPSPDVPPDRRGRHPPLPTCSGCAREIVGLARASPIEVMSGAGGWRFSLETDRTTVGTAGENDVALEADPTWR